MAAAYTPSNSSVAVRPYGSAPALVEAATRPLLLLAAPAAVPARLLTLALPRPSSFVWKDGRAQSRYRPAVTTKHNGEPAS